MMGILGEGVDNDDRGRYLEDQQSSWGKEQRGKTYMYRHAKTSVPTDELKSYVCNSRTKKFIQLVFHITSATNQVA